MQVKVCAECPYTPDDLSTHYDANAALHACAECDRFRQQARATQTLEGAKILDSKTGKATRCVVCNGEFGLIRYHRWRTPLCSKKCVDRFTARQESDRKRLRRLQAV
jgi:hypothetical protein